MFTINDINELLQEHMTEEGFKFWKALEEKVPPIWERPSSSTGKYHKKDNGIVQTIADHTYEMLYVCEKCIKIFNIPDKTRESDVLYLGIILHDRFKFGIHNPLYAKHTDRNHDRIAANTVIYNKDKFSKILSENQIIKLEEMLRFHSGKWSSDATTNFSFKNLKPETLFVHILDMLSTNNLLKVGD